MPVALGVPNDQSGFVDQPQPAPRRRAQDLRTWVWQDSADTLAAMDQLYGAPGESIGIDWPQRQQLIPKRPMIDLRNYVLDMQLQQSLTGLDQFFDVGQALTYVPQNERQPSPKARAQSLRMHADTHLNDVLFNQDTFFGTPGEVLSIDWQQRPQPAPKRRVQDLRTWAWPTQLEQMTTGLDQFFGAPGQISSIVDWQQRPQPAPKRRVQDLRTWIWQGPLVEPFFPIYPQIGSPISRNVALACEISFADPMLAPVWVDVTTYLQSFTTHRGRQFELDRIEAGTATVVLNNMDHRFDPTNTASPYFPNVLSMRRLRLSAPAYSSVLLADKPLGYWRMDDTGTTMLNSIAPTRADSLYRGYVVTDGAVSYWRFGEPSGTTLFDFMGVNPGTYTTTGVTLTADNALPADADTAAGFDGVTGGAAVPHSSSLAFTTAMTVEIWFKLTTSVTARTGFIRKLGAPSPDWGLSVDPPDQLVPNQISFFIRDTLAVSHFAPLSGPLKVNTWYHIVGVYDGSAVRLYINGVEQGAGTAGVFTMANNSGQLQFGENTAAGTFLACALDEATIYGTALSLQQIQLHYAASAQSRSVPDGTYQGGYAQQQTGLPGAIPGNGAVAFNGSSGYVQGKHYTCFNQHAFSIEIWIMGQGWPAGQDSPIFTIGDASATDHFLQCLIRNAGLFMGFYNDDYSSGVTVPGDAKWHQLVFVWEGPSTKVQRIYLDGVLAGPSRTSTGNLVVSNAATTGFGFQVGRYAGSFLAGILDELSIFDYALSSSQIAAHYAAGIAPLRVFTGYVERWPQNWKMYDDAWSPVQVVDAFKIFALTKIPGAYRSAVLNDGPVGYWRLGESGGSSAVDQTANANPGTYVGAPTLGAVGALSGDSDSAVTFNGSSQYVTIPDIAAYVFANAVSVEAWIKTAIGNAVQSIAMRRSSTVAVGGFRIDTTNSNTVEFSVGRADSQTETGVAGSTVTSDNAWHHVVGTYDNLTGIAAIYVDGVLDLSLNVGQFPIYNPPSPVVRIARWPDASPMFNGSIDEVAIYPSALSAARVAAHYLAGVGKFGQHLSGTRINKLLDTINWPSGDRRIDPGQSTIQAVTLSDFVLAHMQSVGIDSEIGLLFIDAAGNVTFLDRSEPSKPPYNTDQATFGESPGQLLYVDITPTYADDTIWNTVQVTRVGGVMQSASDYPSQAHFFNRTLSKTVLVTTDAAALSLAQGLLTNYKDQHYRFEGMVIDPSLSDAHWAQVFFRDIGDRIRVQKRWPTGQQIQQDVIIQSVGHKWDATTPADWQATWSLGPATGTFWVLGLAGASELGVTTLAGW